LTIPREAGPLFPSECELRWAISKVYCGAMCFARR
jgi:hypothetical protein